MSIQKCLSRKICEIWNMTQMYDVCYIVVNMRWLRGYTNCNYGDVLAMNRITHMLHMLHIHMLNISVWPLIACQCSAMGGFEWLRVCLYVCVCCHSNFFKVQGFISEAKENRETLCTQEVQQGNDWRELKTWVSLACPTVVSHGPSTVVLSIRSTFVYVW